jgi:hypothetical protein
MGKRTGGNAKEKEGKGKKRKDEGRIQVKRAK